jgi:hypothetical protein
MGPQKSASRGLLRLPLQKALHCDEPMHQAFRQARQIKPGKGIVRRK